MKLILDLNEKKCFVRITNFYESKPSYQYKTNLVNKIISSWALEPTEPIAKNFVQKTASTK